MDTDIPSPREDMEECTDRNNSHSSQHASLCVPEQGRNQTFAEYGGDGVTRGLVVDVVPRAPQIVTFCAEKGPPISRPILQDREQASTDDSTSVEETLSYKDEAQPKVVCGKGVAKDVIVMVTGNKHAGLSRRPIGSVTQIPATC